MERASEENLYNYLHETALDSYIIELLQYEINKRVYYYGNHYVNSWETESTVRDALLKILGDWFKVFKTKSFKKTESLVLSNSYFTINDELEKKGINVIIPWWSLKKTGFYLKDNDFLKLFNELSKRLINGGINDIVSLEFQEKIKDFIGLTKKMVSANNIKAGIFSNDLGFFERIFIDILKEYNIPTFIFLHGLPGRYNNIDDNRADYLIVWGNSIKDNYIEAGVSADKIIVTGHPAYKTLKNVNLRFELENILVITKPNNGTPAISNNIFLSDRGNSILYLEKLKKVLSLYNVKQVRLRLHPSENVNWYKKNTDTSFYLIDNENLKDSLKKSSLVIGPSSTVIIDSIYAGLNYLVFEPTTDDGYSLMNYPTVKPFNGKEKKIPVAKNENELRDLIDNRSIIDQSVFNEYIASKFDFSEVLKKMK